MGRQSVWSDRQVRDLTRHFILAADEVWRLQGGMDFRRYQAAGGDDPECLVFQEMASSGHYGAGGGTKQGIYVCTPGGQLLASVNSLSAEAVKDMMERGLAAWKALPDPDRRARFAESQPDHRWEWNYPEDGLVLKLTSRYLSNHPVESQQADSRFNFDYAWFSAEEAARFYPDQATVGQWYPLPDVLFQRFVRYHLLSTAHGESGTYRADEIGGTISARVLAADNKRVRLEISGTSRAAARKNNIGHGRAPRIEARLWGVATVNRESGRFEEFELVATGEIFGTVERQQNQPPARRIGWYFTLADPDNRFERLSPAQIYAYDAAWLKKPGMALHGLRPNDPRQRGDRDLK